MNKLETINIKSGQGGGTNGIIKIVVIGAIGVIGVALAIKMIKNSIKSSTSKDAVSDPNVSLAMKLNTAIHPGRNWLTDLFVYADKDTLFAMADQIKDFETIAQKYQNLYNEDLSLELQDALGDEYPVFLERLGMVKAGINYISDEEIAKLAEDLYSDINGLNLTGHDLEPYSSLLRLSDSDFKKCMSLYNSNHSEDFRDALDGESGHGLFTSYQYIEFTDLKDKVLARYDKLY